MWVACVMIVLDLAPPIVFGAALMIGRRRPRVWMAGAAVGAVVVATTVTAAHAGVVFRDPRISLVWLCMMYVVYLVVAGCTILVRRKLVMIPLAVAAWIPMLVGYFIGTVGLLGGDLWVFDMLKPPSEVQVLQNGNVCEGSFWGFAGGGGTAIAVYRDVPGIPFLRREVGRLAYADESGNEITCADAPSISSP